MEMNTLPPLQPDYGKRDYLLPPGCKDLIDVLQQKTLKTKLHTTGAYLIVIIARRSGLSEADAHDIIQRLAAKINEYDPKRGTFMAWVLASARRYIVGKLREKG